MARKKEMLEAPALLVETISVNELPSYLRNDVTACNEQLSRMPVGHRFFYAHIVGVSPLLMHRFTGEKTKKRTYVPSEEAEKAAYRNEQGILYIPNRNIIGLLRDSVATYRWAKSQKEFKEAFMLSLFKILPEQIPIVLSSGEFATSYEIHETSVIHSPKAGRVMEWRPMLRDWQLHFVIAMWRGFLDDSAMGTQVLGVLSQGGIHIGLGDFRGFVNKSGVIHYTGGEFGRFNVIRFAEVVIE